MPTTPFAPALEAALKQTDQSGQLAILKQWIDDPQFFCCISGNTVGVAKDPVPVLFIADRVVCIGDNVTVDFSLSWSPTDTLAGQPYTIVWGDGSPDTNGNFPNPRNPAVETATYVGGYAAVGWYTITLEVTDSLGASATTALTIYARDCTQPAPGWPWTAAAPVYNHPLWDPNSAIVASDTDVYYTMNFHQAFPAWNAFAGAPPAFVEIHDGMLEMETTGDEYLFIADFGGIYEHPMPPAGGVWTARVTADQMATAAGVDAATHTCMCQRLAIAIGQDGWQWCTWRASRLFPHNVPYYVGVAHTRNGWASIHHSSVVASFPFNVAYTQELYIWGIDIVQNEDGRVVFAAVGYQEDAGAIESSRLYASSDYGASWVQVDSRPDYHRWPDVWVPFAGDGIDIYWGMYDTLRKSSNGGTGWATVAAIAGTSLFDYFRLAGPVDLVGVATWTIDNELYEYRHGPVTHITPDLPGASVINGFLVRARDGNSYASETLIAGPLAPATSYIKQNTGGGQNNKEGGWADYYPACTPGPELREYST
jgi:hypothetical protein